MNGKTLLVALAAVWLVGAGSSHAAPEDEKQARPDALETAVPLELEVVFTRFKGESKVSRLPFSLPLNSDNNMAYVKMGLMVPLHVRTDGGKGPSTIMFKDVVTRVHCKARPLSGARFALECGFDQDSVYDDRESMPEKAEGGPVIRRFNSQTTLVLRDGETARHSATDPLSGEVLEVDATLTVVK